MGDDRTTKYQLDEDQLSGAWYNIQADLPTPLAPPLHPGTGLPIGPDDLAPLFPMELIQQEMSQERYIEIPQAVQDIYRLWRPTPLYRARGVEKSLKPAPANGEAPSPWRAPSSASISRSTWSRSPSPKSRTGGQ